MCSQAPATGHTASGAHPRAAWLACAHAVLVGDACKVHANRAAAAADTQC